MPFQFLLHFQDCSAEEKEGRPLSPACGEMATMNADIETIKNARSLPGSDRVRNSFFSRAGRSARSHRQRLASRAFSGDQEDERDKGFHPAFDSNEKPFPHAGPQSLLWAWPILSPCLERGTNRNPIETSQGGVRQRASKGKMNLSAESK